MPQPNPDGSYTFTHDEIETLRSYFEALKQPDITQEAKLQYIQEAQAFLPTEQQQQEHADEFEAIEQKRIEFSDTYHSNLKELAAQQLKETLQEALKQRQEKETQRLDQSHKAELKPIMSEEKFHDIADRQEKERSRLKAQHEAETQRYIREHEDAQKIAKQLEEQSRDTLKPHQPRP
jgi:hypothetical protein